MKNIVLRSGNKAVRAQLNKSRTALAIGEALPVKSAIQTWGEEIYFMIPVSMPLEEDFARDVVQELDMGYWPDGPAFCLFFGPTPISAVGEIRPASAVTVVGKVKGTAADLKAMMSETEITMESEP